jgi:hypothetical protein
MKKPVAVLAMVMMAVGFDWSLPQRSNDTVQITLKNQFSVAVGFYVNDTFVCAAPANSSCTLRVNIRKAPFKLEAWNFNNKIIASHTFDTLAPGKDIIWVTGNVERNSAAPPAPLQTVTTPVPPKTVAVPIAQDSMKTQPAAPKGVDVSYVMSVTTLNYQSQKDQFLAKRTSRAEISRQKTPSGATYTLSGEGGMRIGREGEPVFYKASPVVVSRSLPDDILSSNKAGLNEWFAAVNLTMSGLAQKGKHIRSGSWEDSIYFPEGDGFPKAIRAQFWARPLPKPDDRWILITVDSGMLSFQALDQRYKKYGIQGRYRGILVYSPDKDTFLESAAAFTLYYGQDQFRIEQIQYAADAEGKQLLPLPDLGDYLDFTPKKANPSPQGSLPSWCAQASILFNLLHMGSMSAAEGATNSGGLAVLEQGFLDFLQHQYTSVEKVLGRAAADQLLGDYMKLIDLWNNAKYANAVVAFGKLAWDVTKDLLLEALPYNMGLQYQYAKFTKDLADAVVEDIDAGVEKLRINYQVLKNPSPSSAKPVDLTKPKAPAPKPAAAPPAPSPPPRDEVKKPDSTVDILNSLLDDLLWPAIALAGGAGAYLLASGSGNDYDCAQLYETVDPHGMPCWTIHDDYTFTLPESCGCPSWATKTGTGTYSDGSAGVICAYCPNNIPWTSRLKSATRSNLK